jgi:hypothetical protein
LLLALFRQPVSAWAGLPEWAVGRVLASSAIAAAVALVGAGVAVLAGRRAMGAPVAAALLAGVALADVARAHAGANPQVSARFYESLPEMAALRLADAGRVFSYGPDESPAFRGLLASRTPGLALWSFFVNRQLLGPYTNILDRVETPDAKDLTSLVPRPVLFAPADYDPGQVAGILPGLRQSGVAHVLSLDPLHDPGLRERAVVDSGAPGLQIHVYALEPTLPRAYVACKVQGAASMDDALARPFAPGFDATRDVALEAAAAPVGCRSGAARRLAPASPDEDAYEVQADGPALLVTRERYARGWTARVDGTAAPVLRANGLHRAVAVPAGTHEVRWQYRPPGLALGLALMAAGAAGLAGVLLWPRWI